MDFFDLKDISERYLEILNPSSQEKILLIGQMAGLKPGQRVIDFGCGFGEPLALWAEHYGISGMGIDIRRYACDRAAQKMIDRGLSQRLTIVCADAATYPIEPQSFDVVACVGAVFIWGDLAKALQHLKAIIKPQGKVIIGEPYWKHSMVPPSDAQRRSSVLSESGIFQVVRAAGFDVEYVVHASADDWDRYEAANWRGLLHWIEENPQHPDRQQVIDHLHESQTEYTQWGREYLSWAMYVLNPVKYL